MTKNWEPLKDQIRKLYLTEDKPLDEVMRLVKGQHGFIASFVAFLTAILKSLTPGSERSYRTQLKKWGYTKYSTQAFPKPKTRTRPSKRSSQRPPVVLENTYRSFQGEFSSSSNLPAVSALDSGRSDLYFTTSQISSSGFPASQFDGFGQGTHASASFLTSQNAQDNQGRTQLHRAILDDEIDQVESLLNAGAAVDTQDQNGSTPLHHALTIGNPIVVKCILRFGADVNAQDNLGRAPLHLAVSKHSLIGTLIDEGADATVQDDNGDTPLHLLTSTRLSRHSIPCSAIEILLKSGADPNKENSNKATPFLNLLNRRSYDKEVLEAIACSLRAGGSVNQTLPGGKKPLEIFLSKSETKGFNHRNDIESLENSILRCFLTKGASPITPMPSGQPLVSEYLSSGGYSWNLDNTLDKKLFQHITPDEISKVGNTLLLKLISNQGERTGRVGELIGTLLRHGISPNIQDRLGKSALLRLFQTCRFIPQVIAKTIGPLLENGADPWQRDFAGTCALFEAAETSTKEKEKYVRMMLEADLRKWESNDSPEGRDHDATNSEPWNEWQQAARAVDWGESKELVLREHKFPSNKIKIGLRQCALGVLAEKHVHLAKDKFQGEAAERELRRQYVAGIIRDCRDRGITLDTSCMDYLVDLCL